MTTRSRCRCAAARLLSLWVRIPPGAWIFVCCECCVLSGRGLCNGLIPRPEESYWLWCVIACDLETSWMRRPLPTGGCCAKIKQKTELWTLGTKQHQQRIETTEKINKGRLTTVKNTTLWNNKLTATCFGPLWVIFRLIFETYQEVYRYTVCKYICVLPGMFQISSWKWPIEAPKI